MTPQPAAVDYSPKVMTRYTDAYRVARVIVGAANFVKIVSALILLAGLIVGAAAVDQIRSIVISLAQVTPVSMQMIPFIKATAFLLPALAGALVALVVWFIGVVIAAQGQLLKASVDGCVNTSPFLRDADRVTVMSLG